MCQPNFLVVCFFYVHPELPHFLIEIDVPAEFQRKISTVGNINMKLFLFQAQVVCNFMIFQYFLESFNFLFINNKESF
jgi:hypothetical protein